MLEIFKEQVFLEELCVALEIVELLLVKFMAKAAAAQYVKSLLMLQILKIELKRLLGVL